MKFVFNPFTGNFDAVNEQIQGVTGIQGPVGETGPQGLQGVTGIAAEDETYETVLMLMGG
jgi:hypothetical protein